MSDPMDLLCRARALRGVAEQARIMSRALSTVEDDQARVASHAAVLERDAKRFEEQAFSLVERQRKFTPIVKRASPAEAKSAAECQRTDQWSGGAEHCG